MNIFQRVINHVRNLKSNDPIYKCEVYTQFGCAHVDGILCDMDTCKILEDHRLREIEQRLDIPFKDRLN